MGYDLVADGNSQQRVGLGSTIRTHASAISACVATELLGAVDPRPEQRATFESTFKRPSWATLEEVPKTGTEIVVLAVPTDLHVQVATRALTLFSPRILICEKPAGLTAADSQAIFAAANKKRTSVIVNYFRHYLPNLRHVRHQIRSGCFGELLGGTVLYSHGLRRNGSHSVALLLWLMGDASVLGRIEGVVRSSDPSFAVKVGGAVVNFGSLGHGSVRAGELCLGFSRGLLRIASGGLEISWAQLDSSQGTSSPSYSRANWELLDDMGKCQLPLYDFITSNGNLQQESFESTSIALGTQELLDEILNEATAR
jgi:hypothetical protein